jgi:histidine ammonia-lyase
MTAHVNFGDADLTIEDIWDLARRTRVARVAEDAREPIARSARFVQEALQSGRVVYGVTTGYGDSCETQVPADLMNELPLHLSRYHGCGMGRFLNDEETRAVLAVRLASLVRGWSGVSLDLVDLLVGLLQHDILPQIPAEGSVGASGDLTPLSYVAGVLAGERQVRYRGKEMPALEALERAGLKPIRLKPKEALAIMNGTAVMTGLAVSVFQRSAWLSKLSSRMTAMASLALLGNPEHFGERLALAKPHPGQMRVAARVRADLAPYAETTHEGRLQDRYSIRCAPHVVGVLEDMLPAFRSLIETEINSANDNPLFDPIDGTPLHGGHFYGGHIAFAMDGIKTLVANVADLMDRQLALLVDTRYNNGLPPNLSGATGHRAGINHGLKAVQISASAWTAEALKLTMPASVFSRSTECHNQDKVSMGTIAARDALRVAELTEQVAAAHLIACAQAIRLRLRSGELSASAIGPDVGKFLSSLDAHIPFLDEDVPLDGVLTRLCGAIEGRSFAFGEAYRT